MSHGWMIRDACPACGELGPLRYISEDTSVCSASCCRALRAAPASAPRHEDTARQMLDYTWGTPAERDRVATALAAAERRGAERMRARVISYARDEAAMHAGWHDDASEGALVALAEYAAGLDVDAVLAEGGDGE